MIDFDEIKAWDLFLSSALAGLLASGKVNTDSLEHVVRDAGAAADLALERRRTKLEELAPARRAGIVPFSPEGRGPSPRNPGAA